MNKTLVVTALVAALSGGGAFAQPEHDRGEHGGGPRGGGAPQGGGQQGGGQHEGGPAGGFHPSTTRGGVTQGGGGGPRPEVGQGSRGQGSQGQVARPAERGVGGGGARPGGQFTYRGRSHAPIRGPSFYYPSGWGYRAWGIGQFLPSLFLGSSYYFNDYASYGFGPPPYGYRWVRYGPDLLLVDRSSGRIAEVVRGVFY